MIKDHKWFLVKTTVFIVVYVLVAELSLRVSSVYGSVALVWPPAGMAIAYLLFNGIRYWPVTALAALIVSALSGSFIVNMSGIVGATVEPVLAVYLLKRYANFDLSLSRVRDVLSFILFATILSPLVGAILGVTGQLIAGGFTEHGYVGALTSWWIGDALGILIVTPFMLEWRRWPEQYLDIERSLELTCAVLILAFVSFTVFSDVTHIKITLVSAKYAIFPILIWIALRYGQRISVTAILLVSCLSIGVPLATPHVALSESLRTSLLDAEIFMAVSAVTFMTMSASVAESKVAQAQELLLVKQTARLSQQRARLVALNEAKDEFISIASHQLRTPATAVKQYLGILQQGYVGKLTGDQLRMVKIAYESNERQLRSVNDLLSVAQVQSGNISIINKPCDMQQLVDTVLQSFMTDLATHQQTYEYFYRKNGKYVVQGDQVKLGMMLENIIGNASKYSHKGTRITVKLSKTAQSVMVSVSDQGIGLSKADIRKLFKKFNRVENPLSVQVGGMGLGLYWAKKIIDLHHGTIVVSSVPDKGSTFIVTIPIRAQYVVAAGQKLL